MIRERMGLAVAQQFSAVDSDRFSGVLQPAIPV